MKGLHKSVNHWELLQKVLCYHKDEVIKAKENKLLQKLKLSKGSYSLAAKQSMLLPQILIIEFSLYQKANFTKISLHFHSSYFYFLCIWAFF